VSRFQGTGTDSERPGSVPGQELAGRLTKTPTTAARAKHPHRFGTTTDPKILALPGPAWINQPKETTEKGSSLTAI